MVIRGRRKHLAGWASLSAAGLGLPALMAACATEPTRLAVLAAPGEPQRWQALRGGFITPTLPPAGLPAGGRTGMYLRWTAPVSLALRGGDLLVADGATGRLWRTDIGGGFVTGLPLGPFPGGTAMLLGPDLSAWILDGATRQVLRVGRDGRLRQSLNLPPAMLTPVAMALGDDGLTLRLADGMGAQWLELRGSGPGRLLSPRTETGGAVGSVDGFAPAPGGRLYLLDRLSGLVHLASPDGLVIQSLGRGELLQPVALAADRLGRVYVHDAQDGSVKRLAGSGPVRRWTAQALGLQRIGAIAADASWLAVADPLGGEVVLFALPPEAG